jgi:hypothetical protein
VLRPDNRVELKNTELPFARNGAPEACPRRARNTRSILRPRATGKASAIGSSRTAARRPGS